MSFYNLLKDSLEEFDENEFTVEDGENTVEEILAEEDSTVAIQNEVLEDGEVDDVDTAITLVEDEVEAMESIRDSLESFTAQGKGLDPLGGALLNNHLSVISKRLGVKFVTHSNESFADEAASLQATQDSLESIKEKLQAAWEWIKEAIKKLWASTKEWFKATFTLRGRYEAQAKKLQEVVKGLKSDDPRVKQSGTLEGEVSGEWLLKADGEAFTASELGQVIKSSAKLSDAINVSGLSKLRGRLLMGIDERNQEFEKALNEYAELVNKANPQLAGGMISTDEGKAKWIPFKNPGNIVLPALNQQEMSKLLDDVLEGLKVASREDKKVENELEDAKDIDALEKQTKEAEKKAEGTEEASEEAKVVASVRSVQRQYLQTKRDALRRSRLVVRSQNQAIRGALRWVSQSLANKEETKEVDAVVAARV